MFYFFCFDRWLRYLEWVWIMPVASQQKEPQVVQYHHLLPKPPYHGRHQHHHHIVGGPDGIYVPNDHFPQDLCISDDLCITESTDAHVVERPGQLNTLSSEEQEQQHFISTHSPPIINLSPNLSPSSLDYHRTSPFYDLRESTRRRSTQGKHFFCVQLLSSWLLSSCSVVVPLYEWLEADRISRSI